MATKPVVLIYDISNALVDRCATLLGQTGLFATINTYNEIHAIEALRQYNRCFGLLTNRLACVVAGWNRYKKPREQLLFRVRAEERRSPLRRATPFVIVTEDHRRDLKRTALDPADGAVAAYLDAENFQERLVDALQKVAFGDGAREMNAIACAEFRQEAGE